MTAETQPEENDWRVPIQEAIKSLVDEDHMQDKALEKKAAWYVIIGEDLYKRGFSTPLLKCLNCEQVEYIMNELHNSMCGMHCGQRTLATRVIRAGYNLPTVRQDCLEYVNRCKGYQENGPLIR